MMKHMKQYIISTICAMCAIFSFISCTDDELNRKENKVIEGIPTEVKLSFVAATPVAVETKSALIEDEEYRVHNLYLFVFNQTTGSKEYGQLLSGSELGAISDKSDRGSITLELQSGKKRIYAIANVPDGGSISELKKTLDEITTVNDLLANEVFLKYETIYRQSGKLLMIGVYGGADTDGACTIQPNGSFTLNPISLKRVDARITFNVGIDGGGSDKKFTPKKWQVINVPKRISLFEKQTDISSGQNDYFDMSSPASFETTNAANQSSFTFYMWENRKSTNGLTVYQERELQEKNDDYFHPGYKVNGAFKHAPEYSTYVVLTGDYYEKYTEGGISKERTADVTYTVHLGYADNVNGNLANDFNCERNTSYIYNVMIKNVNDIRLEVTSFKDGEPKEPSPGAEGNIVETDKFYPLDAHFEYDIIVFNKKAIEGRAGFKVKTPFDDGYYTLNGDASGSTSVQNAKDYNWVHFVRNDKGNKNYVKDKYKAYSVNNAIGIKELLEQLKDPTIYDSRGEVVYTMYIDEYYYTTNPITNSSERQLWKKFVNQPNREMHILCNTEYSQDRESSLTTSSIMISQRSIKTFYNEQADGLSTAWGIETINETGRLTPPKENPWDKKNFSTDNGRWNFFQQTGLPAGVSSKWWTNYISADVRTDKNHLVSSLTKGDQLIWACLQRNRDENGNQKIDADEIKWYPASINQYMDIWIGKDALPVEAHLYPNGSNDYRRYLSSDGQEFYAEEGAAINGYKFIYANSISGATLLATYDYRCVRNLGMDNAKPVSADAGKPDDYVDLSKGYFDLKYINKDALRDEANVQRGEFAVHTELDPSNRPYIHGFEYKDADNVTWVGWDDMRKAVDSGNSPCAKHNVGGVTGWRLPNQRELSLMASREKNGWTDSKYHWARTTSSLSGKKDLGYGGTFGFVSIPANDKDYYGPVRCVRDKY